MRKLSKLCVASCGGFPKLGVPFGGPSNKDYTILGSIIGVPLFREITMYTGHTVQQS